MALFFSLCLPFRKAGKLQIPCCQGIAVADYSFTLDALALKPSSFCNVGVNDVVTKKARGYMSIINWGEIYYNTFRVQGEAMAETVLAQLARYPIELVDADRSLTYEAAKLKGKFKIAYADCFAAALAHRLKAKVVTGDQEFRKLEKEIAIEWVA